LGVDLAGFFWLTHRAIAEVVSRYGGHVVNVSAAIAEVVDSGTSLVLAALTKGGLAAAARSLSVGYPSRGIVVNAWHPALSRPRCARRTATRGPVAGFPRRPGQPGERRRGRRLLLESFAVFTRRDAADRRAKVA
jgi:NAD(P)-dependent dehydrogenase (short-subunit alcohol dehydrogenase family)